MLIKKRKKPTRLNFINCPFNSSLCKRQITPWWLLGSVSLNSGWAACDTLSWICSLLSAGGTGLFHERKKVYWDYFYASTLAPLQPNQQRAAEWSIPLPTVHPQWTFPRHFKPRTSKMEFSITAPTPDCSLKLSLLPCSYSRRLVAPPSTWMPRSEPGRWLDQSPYLPLKCWYITRSWRVSSC